MQKKFLTIIFITLLVLIGAYLTVKATYENSWDGWGFGSAQTMTSIKHWIKDGWAKHYFLFIPAGYSQITPYFDNQELNQHAFVDITGSPGEKRVYYTHFPPGYLFPLAFLMELGFENRFWFRLFQILISLTSLLLLYKFLNLIANPIIAFSGSLFYALSVPFLNFADSLANMPIDDFLRMAILVLSLLAINRCHSRAGGNPDLSRIDTRLHGYDRKYLFLIWLLYFILCLSSYDSTFFVFIWLVGLEIIQLTINNCQLKIIDKIKLFPWKKILFFAFAPVLAFLLQTVQNSWYLGFSGMISDFLGAFNKIGLSAGAGYGFIEAHFLQGVLLPITEAFAFPFRVRYLIIFIAILVVILFIIIKNKKINELFFPFKNYFFLLGVAAFIQTLIVLDNHPYKGRILGLFTSLLIGIFIFLIIQIIQSRHNGTKLASKFFIYSLIALTIFMLFLQTKKTIAYIEQWPNNVYNPKIIEFAEELKNTIQPFHPRNPLMFSMFPPQSYNRETIPASMAVYYDMYYYDMPILYFNNIANIIRDFAYLKQVSKYPFSALIVLENENQADEFLRLLPNNLLGNKSIKTFSIQNKYLLFIF